MVNYGLEKGKKKTSSTKLETEGWIDHQKSTSQETQLIKKKAKAYSNSRYSESSHKRTTAIAVHFSPTQVFHISHKGRFNHWTRTQNFKEICQKNLSQAVTMVKLCSFPFYKF